MSLPEYALKHQFAVWFVLLLLTVGGIYSYLTLGRLEDPEYTIKTGVVVTVYPGATAREVEQNVTDTIETAIYRLKQVDKVRSISRPGFSIIYVDLKPSTPTEDLDGCWTILRPPEWPWIPTRSRSIHLWRAPSCWMAYFWSSRP